MFESLETLQLSNRCVQSRGDCADSDLARAWPHDAPNIVSETSWCKFPVGVAENPGESLRPTVITRWTNSSHGKWSARRPQGYYMIALALQRTLLRLYSDGRMVHDRPVDRGMTQTSIPTSREQCAIQAPSDFLHIYLSEAYVAGYVSNRCEKKAGDSHMSMSSFRRDSMVKQLTATL